MPYRDIWTLEPTDADSDAIRTSLLIAGFEQFTESFLASSLPPAQVARVLLAALEMRVQ